jgi:Protein of unknown function (DUF3293)
MTGWTDEARQASIDARQGGKGKGNETHHNVAKAFSANRVPSLMQRPNWSILTANQGNKTTSILNTKHQTQLANDLRRQGASFRTVDGFYGARESSFEVQGISSHAAVALGNRYNQLSILTNRGLTYTAGSKGRSPQAPGTRTPSTGKMSIGKSTVGKYYTRDPRTGSRFSAGLDFSKSKKG